MIVASLLAAWLIAQGLAVAELAPAGTPASPCTPGPEKRAKVAAKVSPVRRMPKNPEKVTRPDWRKEPVAFFDVTFRETNGVGVTLTSIEARHLKTGDFGRASQAEMERAWGTTSIPPGGRLETTDQWFSSPNHSDVQFRTYHGRDAHCHRLAVTITVEEAE